MSCLWSKQAWFPKDDCIPVMLRSTEWGAKPLFVRPLGAAIRTLLVDSQPLAAYSAVDPWRMIEFWFHRHGLKGQSFRVQCIPKLVRPTRSIFLTDEMQLNFNHPMNVCPSIICSLLVNLKRKHCICRRSCQAEPTLGSHSVLVPKLGATHLQRVVRKRRSFES